MSGYVGFVVDKVALGQVFYEYLDFPCQFSFRRLLHTHHLSSGGGTIGQLVADVPSGLSLTPPQETIKNFSSSFAFFIYVFSTPLFSSSLSSFLSSSEASSLLRAANYKNGRLSSGDLRRRKLYAPA
jgi:hypothetical protein